MPVPLALILVELFTSEGCSSCPPADLLLQKLQQEQPIPGVHVIPLSEHVDYWNQLGWKDPFSSALFTSRQRQYGGDDVYTPQMVVDGKAEFVGSDTQKALRAIAEAAKTPKAIVTLHCVANPFVLEIRIDNRHAEADVMLAIAENNLESNVTRGENRGRRIGHTGVARHLSAVGLAKKGQPFAADRKIPLDQTWKRADLSAVVFLQDRATRHVVGTGQVAISACAAN